MKPLIFEFLESPKGESFDYSVMEYDEILNLSINKSTRQPAIESVSVETETFTRRDEDSDSDRNMLGAMMDTNTYTKSHEVSDSDPSRISVMMETLTFTADHNEGTDSDRDTPM